MWTNHWAEKSNSFRYIYVYTGDTKWDPEILTTAGTFCAVNTPKTIFRRILPRLKKRLESTNPELTFAIWDQSCVCVCLCVNGSLFLQYKSHPYGPTNAGANQNVSEKPIINAEVVLFLRVSKDNKVWLRNQNHMGWGDDAYKGSSNNKLLAAVYMTGCEAHMRSFWSQFNESTFI